MFFYWTEFNSWSKTFFVKWPSITTSTLTFFDFSLLSCLLLCGKRNKKKALFSQCRLLRNIWGLVFCCNTCLDLPDDFFLQMWVIWFPIFWEQEHGVEKQFVQVQDRRSRICDLFETLFLLKRTGKTLRNVFEHVTNVDNYSNINVVLVF